MLERFEAADRDPELVDRGGLTFVVVGGGPTGVETAGALAELFAMVFRKDYPSLDVSRARVVLRRDAGPPPAPVHGVEPPSRPRDAALPRRRRATRRPGRVACRATRSRWPAARCCRASTLVWAAGVQANPLAAALDLPSGRGGRVTVEPDLSVPGRPGAWAIGDVAAATDRRGEVLPQLAPVAMQSGRHVARQIRRLLEGRPTTPFRYRDKGIMATIGRRAAVAELPGRIHLRGGARLGGVARPAPRHARRPPQPGVRPHQLGVELPHLGPRPPPHHEYGPRAMPADAATIRATVDAYCAAFTNGDRAAYVGLFADDAWIEDPGRHGAARGPRRHRRASSTR